MTEIEIVSVRNYALKNVNLKFKDKEFSIVLGPSGAGKTTLLKVIAGVVKYKGHVYFNGKCVDNVFPGERKVGYVPQSLALFNHMTVWDNVAFGLKVRGISEKIVYEKVSYTLKLMDIYHLRNKYPLKLSGGERQRVAIARALAIEPKILLLDEPFSNLHVSLKLELLSKIISISKEKGLNVIIATHNLDYTEMLNERTVVLNDGKVVYDGMFKDLLLRKEILDILPIVSLHVDSIEPLVNGLSLAKVGNLKIIVPWEREDNNVRAIIIPSDKIVLSNIPQRIQANTYPALVRDIHMVNSWVNLSLEIKDVYLEIKIPYSSIKDLKNIKKGVIVYIKFPIRHIRVI